MVTALVLLFSLSLAYGGYVLYKRQRAKQLQAAADAELTKLISEIQMELSKMPDPPPPEPEKKVKKSTKKKSKKTKKTN